MIAPLLPHPEHQQLFMFLQIQLAHLCQYACMPKLVSRGGFLTLDTTTSEAWQSLGYSGLACKGEVNARADKQVKESKNMRARTSSQKYAPRAAPRQTDRKQLSCQRLACASPFLWLLGLKQASRIKLSETGCAIVQCQPNIMNIIVAHINSREIWLAFLCVWVGADDPRCNCVAGSPRNDHNTDLQFAGHCHKD